MIRKGPACGVARHGAGSVDQMVAHHSVGGHLIRFMAIVEAKSWLIELAKVSTFARAVLWIYD